MQTIYVANYNVNTTVRDNNSTQHLQICTHVLVATYIRTYINIRIYIIYTCILRQVYIHLYNLLYVTTR